jgi:hypothetical protein
MKKMREDKLKYDNEMVWTHFKNKWRENFKEHLEHESEWKRP